MTHCWYIYSQLDVPAVVIHRCPCGNALSTGSYVSTSNPGFRCHNLLSFILQIQIITMRVVVAVAVATPPTIDGVEDIVAQFKSPNRALWESEEFLFAQALAIQFVFPRTCDVEFHGCFPFSVLLLQLSIFEGGALNLSSIQL